jgi:transposase
MEEPACQGCRELLAFVRELQASNARLQAQVDELTRKLDEATRKGKRQASPFSKGPPMPRAEKGSG